LTGAAAARQIQSAMSRRNAGNPCALLGNQIIAKGVPV